MIVVFYLILINFAIFLLSLRSPLFSNKSQKGGGSGWHGRRGGTGGLKGEETLISIYYKEKYVL